MTAFDRIERRMPEVFDDLASARVPDYFDDMLRQTARTRQRPAWSALERWLSMGVIARPIPVRPVPWRLAAATALVLLIIAASLIYVAGRPPAVPPPFGLARNGPMLIGTADGDIVRYDPASGTTTPVVATPDRDSGPFYSYDGRRFVFDRGSVDAMALYVANADGSDVRHVPMRGRDLRTFEWLPNSDRVLETTSVNGYGALSIVDLVTGTISAIALDRALDIQSAVWRPGREQIVFTATDHDIFRTFWVVNPDGSGLRQIGVSPRAINDPTISPDGRLLAYATWEATSPAGRIRVLDIDAGGDHEVTRPDTFVWQSPTFSADGIHLLLHRLFMDADPTLGQVASLDIRDGSAVAMGQASRNPQPAILWSPDGAQILAEYQSPKETWLFDADGTNGRVAPFSGLEFDGASWQRLAP
jgi:WD40 repeat protein